jgi:hypothetical protein
MKYCQCRLKKGTTEKTAWIPEMHASKGKYIKILDDDGWKVIEAGSRMNEEYIFGHERDFQKQRKASDI